MLTHHGPVSALSFHSNGHLMATAGTDKKIKIWDLRKFEVLQTLPGHAKTLDFSQKGLLATSTGSFVQILGDFSGSQNYSRYMTHSIAKGYQIQKVMFRPYEDVLGLGHSMGWSSILIPGSGEPNFDSWVANPFETPKQRREKEVPNTRSVFVHKDEAASEVSEMSPFSCIFTDIVVYPFNFASFCKPNMISDVTMLLFVHFQCSY
ncbi:hypothetical protein Vadar_019720 [Vaccinium darrowii]|uniref:Uncharacterized protein n=1 Tax=Vaccinium darrowii TaxID=229202 RepID=A0ACB7YQ55_9ERIC|nr:hypothetical protein Vadar_019720 [Vaccinium darrowii]